MTEVQEWPHPDDPPGSDGAIRIEFAILLGLSLFGAAAWLLSLLP